ncbi:MAG: glutamate 5-kinase [Nitrososphaerota archaeon]|nr:glutamate 5-kinase [Nitrososphaerota archaeon]
MPSRDSDLTSRLIVVKVGTGSITSRAGELDVDEMRRLAEQMAGALKMGHKIVLVTSGAVAAGVAELGLPSNSRDIVYQQAFAATGQSVLMAKYRELFNLHGVKIAQVLLTAEDLSNRASYLHTRNVLKLLLKIGVIPIINENDVTSVDELVPVTEGFRINFSDNDILSALVANAIRADTLIILSDVDGLYTSNPKNPGAEMIKEVHDITKELKGSLSGKSKYGKGGIQSKINAAEIATKSGIPVVIANSRRENVILDVLSGKEVGTRFDPKGRISAVKSWIAYGASVKGKIFVNAGAKKAIREGSSLLPVGVMKVVGNFKLGEIVSIVDEEGVEFAKGNPNYDSGSINMIKGLQMSMVKKKLGDSRPREVVGRKKMHLTREG